MFCFRHIDWFRAVRARLAGCSAVIACVLLLVVGMLGSHGAVAQRYTFHNLNVDDGLIQSQAMSMAQDSTGYLWIATIGGLSRYDGRGFVNYTVRNGLPANTVGAVATDKLGNVWIGTKRGIARFNGKSFDFFQVQQAASNDVNGSQQLFVVGDTVWWRTAGEVYYVTKGKVKYFTTPAPVGKITALYAEPGAVLVGSADTIYGYQNGVWTKCALPSEANVPTHGYIHCLYRTKENEWLAGTSVGLFVLVDKVAQRYQVAGTPTPPMSVRAIAEDKTGKIWLALGNGAAVCDHNSISLFSKRNGLIDNQFHNVLCDQEGNVWLASDGQGIFRFSGTVFTVLDESMGLSSAQVMAIASNKRDSLIFGTYEAGLFVFKDGKVEARPLPGDDAGSVTALCYASNRKLWIGTRDRGIYVYSDQVFRQYSAPTQNFPSNYIYSLYEAPDGKIYVGFNAGAVVYYNDTFRTMDVKGAHVLSFLSIGYDSLLLATEKSGLLLYSNGAVSDYVTNTIIDSSSVNCFIKVGEDLWLGTADNGAIRYRMSTGELLVANKRSGMRSDFVYNITYDDAGNIWAGTGYGLHNITVQGTAIGVSFYGKDMGVAGMESNINAVCNQADGSIWFGTTKGAICYQPKASMVVPAPTAVFLQSVKLAGEEGVDSAYFDSVDAWYGVPYHLSLPFKKNTITFTFGAVSLCGADQLLYRYMIDGLDAPWSEWSTVNSVTYSALPPGHYVFRVQCMGGNGAQPRELAYEFQIATPFHKTWWFTLGVFLLSIIAGVLIQIAISRRRQRRQRLRARLRAEEQAKIRLRTAEDFHDEVGNKLTRINVLTDVLKAKTGSNPDVARILAQIKDNTAQLYGGTRDILWSLKPSNDNLYEILARINDFGNEVFQDTDIKFSFTGIEERWRQQRLPMDMSRNLSMIFKEALNNVLKYANAKDVQLTVNLKRRDQCTIVLTDNGRGFDTRLQREGNGLNNMMVRAERFNGKLYVDSRIGKGTTITLTFRIPRHR
jgi:signal transduction histidine kinase/ligand-binding sensor domain-containing protein